ncbi:MAG: hypothetical protein V1767_00875 [Chloroflexota bacterium]
MDEKILAWLFKAAGEIGSNAVHTAVMNGFKAVKAPEEEERAAEVALISPPTPDSTALTPVNMSNFRKPTTEETIQQLEGRLVRQLLRLQEDLLEGARINNIPCDCLAKHCNEMDITAEELQTMSQKPIYQRVRDWCKRYNWGPDEVAKHPKEFFVNLVPELRSMRKDLTGTEPLKPATLPVIKTEEPKAISEPKPDLSKIKILAQRVKNGEITKEEAVFQVKEMLSTKTGT